jgi:hypothetical protein
MLKLAGNRAIDKYSVSAEPASVADTALSDSAEVRSLPNDPRRIQTGQIPLSLVTEDFVPQVSQVRISCRLDPLPVLPRIYRVRVQGMIRPSAAIKASQSS